MSDMQPKIPDEIAKEMIHQQVLENIHGFLDIALGSQLTTSPYFLVKTDIPIIAGYCIYRDVEYLRSSLDSLCMYVNAIVLFDGRFLDFKELPPDNTYEIISDVALRFDPRWFVGNTMNQKFVYVNTDFAYGPMLEVEKRQLMLDVVRARGFLFILDGDEICVGDVKTGLDIVRANPDKKIFWVYVEEQGNPGWKPRIIKVENGMHYGANHWTILDKKNLVITDSDESRSFDTNNHCKITQFRISNLGSLRSGERGKERVKYREIMRSKKWVEQDIAPAMGSEIQQ
ncbi:MAG: hypothetical protein ACYC9R_12895 [Nitrosotalea sp.]